MIYGAPYEPYKQFYDEPQFNCSAEGCEYAEDELHQCIACQKLFCKDCLIRLGEERYCATCAKCACGELAIDTCQECGAVQCGKCLGDFNECKPCRKKHMCVCCANGQHGSHLIGDAKCDCLCHPKNNAA